uniref:Uncharacterized protein n=1 Tax=Tetranychus urticae TaxID=32264 RepID=T1JTA6_TETUR
MAHGNLTIENITIVEVIFINSIRICG